MADLASLVVEVESRGARQTAADLDRLGTSADKAADEVAQLENAGRRGAAGLRDLDTVARNVEQSTSRAARGLGAVARAANDNRNSFGLMGHQVRNLTAQFVDLGTQLASGGGIFLPLIQQGPQAIDAVGGVRNAIGLLGQSLARIGPVALTAFAGVGAAIGGAFAAIGSDNTRREIENLTDQFRIVENQFGRGLNAGQAEEAMRGVMEMAQRTGLSIKTLAAAQRDLMAAGAKGGPLAGGFGVDGDELQTFVDLLKRTGTEFDATGDLAKKFFADMRKGSLDQKTLNELMEQSPKFAREFINALGGAGKVQQQFQSGVGVSARQAMTALQSVGSQLQGMQRVIPSVGSAWSEAAGKASAAATAFQLALSPNSRGIAESIATAILSVGNMFERAGMNAGAAGAAISQFTGQISATLTALGAVADQITVLQNFTSPIKMFEATKAEIEGISAKISEWLGVLDQVNEKFGITTNLAKGLQGLVDPPAFLKNTIAELDKIMGLIDRAISGFNNLVSRAQSAGQTVDDMNRRNADAAAARLRASGLGDSPGDFAKGGLGGLATEAPIGATVTGEQFGPLLSEMERQTTLQETFQQSLDKSAAASQAGSSAAEETAAATSRFGTMQVQAVQDGVRVWSSGNDNVAGKVNSGAQSTRAGLSSVEAAIRQLNLRGGGGSAGTASGGGSNNDIFIQRGNSAFSEFVGNGAQGLANAQEAAWQDANPAKASGNYDPATGGTKQQKSITMDSSAPGSKEAFTSWGGQGSWIPAAEMAGWGLRARGISVPQYAFRPSAAAIAEATRTGKKPDGTPYLGQGGTGGAATMRLTSAMEAAASFRGAGRDAYMQDSLAETAAAAADLEKYKGGGTPGTPGYRLSAQGNPDAKNPDKFYNTGEYAWENVGGTAGTRPWWEQPLDFEPKQFDPGRATFDGMSVPGGDGGDGTGQQLLQATNQLPVAIGQEVAVALQPIITAIIRSMSTGATSPTAPGPLLNRTAPVQFMAA